MWVVDYSRYRVVELYYDALDKELPPYMEPQEERTFLSALPRDVVVSIIWPLLMNQQHVQNVKEMARLRGVCRA